MSPIEESPLVVTKAKSVVKKQKPNNNWNWDSPTLEEPLESHKGIPSPLAAALRASPTKSIQVVSFSVEELARYPLDACIFFFRKLLTRYNNLVFLLCKYVKLVSNMCSICAKRFSFRCLVFDICWGLCVFVEATRILSIKFQGICLESRYFFTSHC